MEALRRENPLARLLGSWAFWLFLLAASFLRVVEVDTGQERAYRVLLPFQEIRVEFLNSVTGRPVLLEFRPLFRFQAFRAYTDPETEAYYTGGTYPWNQALAQERRKTLRYCSESGLALKVGARWFRAEGACVGLRLLYP